MCPGSWDGGRTGSGDRSAPAFERRTPARFDVVPGRGMRRGQPIRSRLARALDQSARIPPPPGQGLARPEVGAQRIRGGAPRTMGARIDTVDEVKKPTVVEARKSVRKDDILSFIDGKPCKTLKRHLTLHGLKPRSCRERYGLPLDHPMVVPSYAERRSALAKAIGLGCPGGWLKTRRGYAARSPDRARARSALPPGACPAAERLLGHARDRPCGATGFAHSPAPTSDTPAGSGRRRAATDTPSSSGPGAASPR
ncbi:hypothetical protein CLBKND_04781 [Methylorubrum aminovorans]